MMRKNVPVELTFGYVIMALALWILLLWLVPEATADGVDGPTSTIEIVDIWYSSESQFHWAADGQGNNLSSLEIWYFHTPVGGVANNWNLSEIINLSEKDESGNFSFSFPDGAGYYTLESNASDSTDMSEFVSSENFTGEQLNFDDVKPTSLTTLASGTRTIGGNIDVGWEASDNFQLKTVQLKYRYRQTSTETPGVWTNFQTLVASGTNATGDFTAFDFPDGEGRYDFRIVARDYAGNEEDTASGQEAYIILDFTPAEGETDYSGDYWVTGNTVIPWSVSDNYELYSVELRHSYKADNSSGFGDWISFQSKAVGGTSSTGTFNFVLPEGQGIYNLWIVFKDNAGNSGPDLPVGQGDLSLGYDTEAPSGSITYTGDYWHNSETTIQYSAQDNVDIGEVQLDYKFKTDSNSAYSNYIYAETYTTTGGKVANGIMEANGFSGSGLYQFRIELTDSAGNIWTSSTSSFTIGFDMDAPVIFLTDINVASPHIFYDNNLEVLYYSSVSAVTEDEIELEGVYDDFHSGTAGSANVESSFVTLEVYSSEHVWSASFFFPPLTSGNQTITILALDVAGNLGSITILVVDDINPPETSIALIIKDEVVDETENYTINRETKYSLSSHDAESGIMKIEYRFNSSLNSTIDDRWKIYNGTPFAVPLKTNAIIYRATDYAGNQESNNFLGVELINLGPSGTIHHPSSSSISIEQGEEITFNGTGEDQDGVIVAYRWRSSIDGLLSKNQTFTISNLSAGIHTITFSVMDDQGYWSSQALITVEVADEGNQWILWLIFALIVLAGAIAWRYAVYTKFAKDGEESAGTESKTEALMEQTATNCISCGGSVNADAQFCKKCGYNLEENAELPREEVTCTSCSEPIPVSKNFCKSCGAPAPEKTEISEAESCVKCGEPLVEGKEFCKKCGEKVA